MDRRVFSGFLAFATACGPSVRYVRPADTVPSGQAVGAQRRLLATHEDGTKDYALVLRAGDEVMTAILDFAKSENVGGARLQAIGAVRDAEVGWYDAARKEYRVTSLPEQAEVISLTGDVGAGASGAPVVHVHCALQAKDGPVMGGHLLGAITSPTLEVFVTVFPQPLAKRPDPTYDLQLFDLTTPPQGAPPPAPSSR
jgi:predicted DNA-binding protein with PD1-like motif